VSWSVEVIIGCVRAFSLGAFVSFVAAFGGRLAAVGVHALDVRHTGERALPCMSHAIHQEPLDRVWIEGVDMSDGLAGDFTAIFKLPCRSRRVLADYFVIAVAQFRLRCLERPGDLAVRAGLTGVDLRSLGMREQDNFLACGHLNRVGHVGCGLFLRVRQRKAEQNREVNNSGGRNVHESTHGAILAGKDCTNL
jgi:hypothetical protein